MAAIDRNHSRWRADRTDARTDARTDGRVTALVFHDFLDRRQFLQDHVFTNSPQLEGAISEFIKIFRIGALVGEL